MAKIFNILAPLCIAAIVVVALLTYLVSGIQTTTVDDSGNTTVHTGIYNVLGIVPSDEEADNNVHKVPDSVENVGEPPEIEYTEQILQLETPYIIGSLVNIGVNSNMYPGTDGEAYGFFITLMDVKDSNGHSVLTMADYDITEEQENITTICLYNTIDNTLTFYSTGSYDITMKVMGKNGKSSTVSFKVPIGS